MKSRGMWALVLLVVLAACGQGANEDQESVVRQDYKTDPLYNAD